MVFLQICYTFVLMEEIDHFVKWARVQVNTLNALIIKIEEKQPLGEDELEMIEKVYLTEFYVEPDM